MFKKPEGETYCGYPVINTDNPTKLIQELDKRSEEITITQPEGRWSNIEVDGVIQGRNPRIVGIVNDPQRQVDGQFIVETVESAPHPKFLVPADKLRIGTK